MMKRPALPFGTTAGPPVPPDLPASLLNLLKSPETLEYAAAGLMPLGPAGGIVGTVLRLAATWLRDGKSVEEVQAIVAGYSQQAQDLADHWNDDGGADDPDGDV